MKRSSLEERGRPIKEVLKREWEKFVKTKTLNNLKNPEWSLSNDLLSYVKTYRLGKESTYAPNKEERYFHH